MKNFDPTCPLPPGVQLIEASAGTGKTYTITTLYLRLIVELGLTVQQILVVTFTRAATAELRDRIRGRLREALEGKDPIAPNADQPGQTKDRLLKAMLDIDEACIQTIHGFCTQVLKDHAFEIGSSFDAKFIDDESVLNDEITADFWTQQHHQAPQEALTRWKTLDLKHMKAIATELSRTPELRVIPDDQPNPIDPALGGFFLEELDEEEMGAPPPTVVRFKKEFVEYYKSELPSRKKAMDRFGHMDTLTGVDDALHGPHRESVLASLRQRFHAALIDEFQDTDPIQYRIFHTVFSSPLDRMFLIGDPKQAIYSFRGADLNTYLFASRGASDRSTLHVNHRSDEPLVQAINHIFSRENPFLNPEIHYPPVQAKHPRRLFGETERPPLTFHFVESRNREWVGTSRKAIWAHMAEEIAAELKNPPLIQGRPMVAGDIAILIRNNWTASVIQSALHQAGIPSVRRQNSSVFNTDEATEVLEVLEAVAAPRQRRRVRAALSSSPFGLTAAQLDQLSDNAWDQWLERFDHWLQTWQRSGVMAMLTQVIAETEAPRRILSWKDGERQMTNWFHLAELLHHSERSGNLGPIALIEWLRSERRDGSSDTESSKIRLETDDAAVQILTMHTCKGLQFPVVWCPVLWEKESRRMGDNPIIFHDPKQQDRVLDVGSPWLKQNRARQSSEQHTEALRLTYVALTRAQHACHVVYGAIEGVEDSPLAWLLHHRGKTLEQNRAHVRASSASDLLGEIQQWERSYPHLFAVKPLRRGKKTPTTRVSPPSEAAPVTLTARSFDRAFDRNWRVASFSALSRGGDGDEAPDHDATVSPIPPSEHPRIRVPLHDFPRGTEAGTFLHKVLELADFTDADSLHACVSMQLPLHGFPLTPWGERLTPALQSFLLTPLSAEDPWSLSEVPRRQRIDEWEFMLPASGGLTPSKLHEVFQTEAPQLAEYLRRLHLLDFNELQGFLRGFVDLIVERNGRWYVLDYKSNHLGDAPEHYTSDRIRSSMFEHHYPLQYLLYVVALHRHLGRTLPDYSYESHFGGVFYLFLRGMDPARPGHAVFADRPSLAMISALEAAITGGP